MLLDECHADRVRFLALEEIGGVTDGTDGRVSRNRKGPGVRSRLKARSRSLQGVEDRAVGESRANAENRWGWERIGAVGQQLVPQIDLDGFDAEQSGSARN